MEDERKILRCTKSLLVLCLIALMIMPALLYGVGVLINFEYLNTPEVFGTIFMIDLGLVIGIVLEEIFIRDRYELVELE